MVHEETHAHQKHSIDLLLIEVLLVLFWFNPLLWILRHKIILNHEFLADFGALKRGGNVYKYQNLILNFSMERRYSGFTHTINYSSLKKRLLLMKTQSSKKSMVLRSSLLFPMLIAMVTFFGETKTIAKNNTTNSMLTEISNTADTEHSGRTVQLAGLVLDSESLSPLPGAKIYSGNGKVIATTDARGYFDLMIEEIKPGDIRFSLQITEKKYLPLKQIEHWGNLPGQVKSVFIFGLQKKGSSAPQFSELITNIQGMDYEDVMRHYPTFKSHIDFEAKLRKQKQGNQKILFEVDHQLYIVNHHAWLSLIHISEPTRPY